MVGGVEEVAERLVAHPLGTALFFDAGDADIDAAHIAEAGTAQPALQGRYRGQIPDVAHLRITVFRHQHLLLVTFDHQRLQHQLAAFDQAVLEGQQVLYGGAAVIEHAHGKHGVETFQVGRQVFQGERQVPGRQLWQVLLYCLELAEEQPVGIDPDHHVGTCAEHAPLVVAVAAADIEHTLALEVQVRADP
ncbi:hypothetical protein D3C81_1486140 [compost metagenome]